MIVVRHVLSSNELRDYKFYCFYGHPKLVQVISDRSTNERIDFYNMKWFRINGLTGLTPGVANSNHEIPCPSSFEDMKSCAAKLSRNIPFSRIDFYDINGKAYFGEITFYPASGFGEFRPKVWGEELGKMIELPI